MVSPDETLKSSQWFLISLLRPCSLATLADVSPRSLTTDDGRCMSPVQCGARSGKVVMVSLMVTTWTPGHMTLLSGAFNFRDWKQEKLIRSRRLQFLLPTLNTPRGPLRVDLERLAHFRISQINSKPFKLPTGIQSTKKILEPDSPTIVSSIFTEGRSGLTPVSGSRDFLRTIKMWSPVIVRLIIWPQTGHYTL